MALCNGFDDRYLWIWLSRPMSGRRQKCQGPGCQAAGTVPAGGHYAGREMSSFFIFHCNVERFMPSRTAAPLAPPSTQLAF